MGAVGITGTEDLENAATYLADAEGSTDDSERTVLLTRAIDCLKGRQEARGSDAGRRERRADRRNNSGPGHTPNRSGTPQQQSAGAVVRARNTGKRPTTPHPHTPDPN
ncbi:hypothetical protein OHA98_39845 [Streptomyces sp. NBC_00654]|uniref:hypothetical protein n=1 Tax=Streptomyces sp. NBC_00654 TaxID=2975799 RepID=UPI0022539F0B|nr:hypothetical protein [Streptomyces sp. NBC_00654]MCX4970796.1 hypothetical protein [Streptomyces sp. NBC_00654]